MSPSKVSHEHNTDKLIKEPGATPTRWTPGSANLLLLYVYTLHERIDLAREPLCNNGETYDGGGGAHMHPESRNEASRGSGHIHFSTGSHTASHAQETNKQTMGSPLTPHISSWGSQTMVQQSPAFSSSSTSSTSSVPTRYRLGTTAHGASLHPRITAESVILRGAWAVLYASSEATGDLHLGGVGRRGGGGFQQETAPFSRGEEYEA